MWIAFYLLQVGHRQLTFSQMSSASNGLWIPKDTSASFQKHMWVCDKVNLFQNLQNKQASIHSPLHKNKLCIQIFILFLPSLGAQFLWETWQKQCHLYRIRDKSQIQNSAYLRQKTLLWKISFYELVTETIH